MSGTGLGLWAIIIIALVAIGCVFFIRRYKKKGNNKSSNICPHCRKPVESDAVYCENCGTKVSTESEAAEESTNKDTASRKKLLRQIRISIGVLLGTIFVSIFTLSLFHQWRWDGFYGSINRYEVGGYMNDSQNAFGLYRFHQWYGYEDLTDGYTLQGLQVTNDYIAILKERSGKMEWTLWSPDFHFGYSFDGVWTGYNDILPLIFCQSINDSYSEELVRRTNLLWVKKGGYWGAVNLRTKTYQIPFEYEDVEPTFRFEEEEVHIICKKNGLWGMISIPNNTSSTLSDIVTETIPYIFENPENLPDVKLSGEVSP